MARCYKITATYKITSWWWTDNLDAVIIAVTHKQLRGMSVEDIVALMNGKPVLVDVRGMVDRDAAEKLGMYYRKL